MKKYNEIFFSAYKFNLMSDYLTFTSAGLATVVQLSNNKARLVAIDDLVIEKDMADSITGGQFLFLFLFLFPTELLVVVVVVVLLVSQALRPISLVSICRKSHHFIHIVTNAGKMRL